MPVAPATPSCCNASYTPQSAASYAQPAATYSQPAATYSQPAASYPPVAAPGTTVRSLAPTYAPATSQPSVPSYSPPATLSAPTLSNVPPNNVPQSGTGNQTFEAPNEFKPAQPQSRVITPIDEPAADESPNSNTSAPRLFNQQHLDRSAALPIRKASLTKAPTVTRSVKQLDDSGWHAGRN